MAVRRSGSSSGSWTAWGATTTFVSDLIDQFLTDAPELVEAARAGVASGDAGEVRRALHTLTSNAATFGATDLAVSGR